MPAIHSMKDLHIFFALGKGVFMHIYIDVFLRLSNLCRMVEKDAFILMQCVHVLFQSSFGCGDRMAALVESFPVYHIVAKYQSRLLLNKKLEHSICRLARSHGADQPKYPGCLWIPPPTKQQLNIVALVLLSTCQI